MLLESAGRFEIAGEGETPSEVLELHPEVIVIDAPPNTDPGPIVTAATASSNVAIVVLLDEEDLAQCSAALEAGAAGLVGRRHSPQTLFAAIDRVSAGETSVERSILSGVVRMSKPHERQADRYQTLSTREKEVHTLVTQGLRNKEIALRLFISEATVRHHMTAIFGKLGVSGRLELLASQWRRTAAAEPIRAAGRGFPR